MRKLGLFVFLLFAGSAVVTEVAAQKFPERGQVRQGNRDFEKERYEMSLERYSRAAELAPDSFEATYNRAGALYRLERYEEAAQALAPLAADSLLAESDRAEVFYNLGNAQFKQRKLQEALESYKNSLRLNPADSSAGFNYAYVKKLLEQPQQDPQDNPQDQNQDQQQDPQQQPDSGEQQEQEPQKPPQGQQPQPTGVSPEEQQRMLEAIQAQEDKTQEKLKEREGVLVRGSKNW